MEDLTDRILASGMPRAEARRQALVEVGGIEQVKEQVRETWFGHGLETTLRDIRYACSSLKRSPGFTAVVMATLALGIGATLTMFSLMRAVLWRPLPYLDPNHIVTIRVDARNTPDTGATRGEVQDLRERSHALEQVSMITPVDTNFEYAGEMEHFTAARVSDDFLPLLGVKPALGRLLDSRLDQRETQDLAILISDDLWRRRFSADPGIIGRAARINNVDMQIAGVLPAGFRLFLPPSVNASEQIHVWLPDRIDTRVPFRGVPVLARLRPGVTLDQANAELEILVRQFEQQYPVAYAGGKGRFTALPLHREMTRGARPALILLSAAVGFVLLIACVNVANLMLARGSARHREFEIRRALGAGRIRIVRQLLTESLMLAIAAAVLGLFSAHWALAVIGQVSASHIPLQSRIGIDAEVAVVALGLSLVTSILFGLLPAWRLACGKVNDQLQRGRAETARVGTRRIQRMLVMSEIALSILPIACGGLFLRSFVNLLNAPLGFRPTQLVTAKVPFDARKHSSLEQRWPLLRDVLDRVRALPGVESVSATWPLPLAPDQQTRRVGRADKPDALPILATQQFAIPGYLAVMVTPLRAGRDFNSDDVAGERAVTIIDETLAKRLWPDGAIGQRLVVHRTGRRDELEIIGVTAAARITEVRDENWPHFLLPYGTYPDYMAVVVRTRETAQRMAPGIKAAVNAAQVGRAPFDIKPMSRYVSDSIGDTRFLLYVLTAFAGTSVLLAAVGLYGTLAYLTLQRTQEFGIRLALGCSIRKVAGMVLREGMLLALSGAVVGLIGVAAMNRAIGGLLYSVRPLDSLTLAGVVAFVGIVALAAATVPAWRAARIDPQILLRSE